MQSWKPSVPKPPCTEMVMTPCSEPVSSPVNLEGSALGGADVESEPFAAILQATSPVN